MPSWCQWGEHVLPAQCRDQDQGLVALGLGRIECENRSIFRLNSANAPRNRLQLFPETVVSKASTCD
jgi:hypothetical protein